ncbi:MAG TPA: hypothetical protein EYP64_02980 [Desulfarculaceae bacterium]|nr:hypothetical protein [Desulfarculaceae bacterium]
MSKRVKQISALFLLVSFLVGGLVVNVYAESKVMYNKYNIHAQADKKGLLKSSYANYTDPGAGHVIVPPNTKLTIKLWRRFMTRVGFYYELPNGRRGAFEVQEKRVGMSLDDYEELILSPQPVSLKGFSAIDLKGIKKGKAYKGMTKKGVMTALGYPAAHETPSLDDNQWKYWRNRFRTVVVEFNSKGKVVNVRY